jgi:hypothetical protein
MHQHCLVEVVNGRAGIDTSSADALNDLVSRCQAEWLAIGNVEPEVLSEVVGPLSAKTAASTAALLLGSSDVSARRIETRTSYPALLATLVRPPAGEMVPVLRVAAFDGEFCFRDVSDPLWDFLIRAARLRRLNVRASYEALVARESDDSPSGELVPNPPARTFDWLAAHLRFVQPNELVERVESEVDAIALKAGLFQIHNFLDASHEQSQGIEGEGKHRSGDYWHAIMHRREPDYSNSKYWFRQVGRHPVFGPLAQRATDILAESNWDGGGDWQARLVTGRGWDPTAFVDMCQTAVRSADAEFVRAASQIQRAEMHLLLAQTYADASGEEGR